MAAMFAESKKSRGDRVPAMTLTNASIAGWLPWIAPKSCCIGGDGGARVAIRVVNS